MRVNAVAQIDRGKDSDQSPETAAVREGHHENITIKECGSHGAVNEAGCKLNLEPSFHQPCFPITGHAQQKAGLQGAYRCAHQMVPDSRSPQRQESKSDTVTPLRSRGLCIQRCWVDQLVQRCRHLAHALSPQSSLEVSRCTTQHKVCRYADIHITHIDISAHTCNLKETYIHLHGYACIHAQDISTCKHGSTDASINV